ncbi:2232_t:CDS:2 [Funneliformis geosporum]|uniref:2232_t:CDS:1 n=1 Tax=Funneliformis geosporum TaxID=1117311 RepID=A0A9W4X956_9GLOM|nr:2232_t:CDS:2 [Funneliformis geosporum]
MDLSTETGNKPLSPSQIRAREKQKKQNQEQSQQAQIIQPTHESRKRLWVYVGERNQFNQVRQQKP